LVRTLWEDLALVGFGRRASVGFGAFQVEAWEPWPALATLAQGANAWTSLSTWVPAATDPTEGWYRLRQKHGRVGEDLAQRRGAAVFKRALLQIEPGSTFKLRDPLREWYGRLVNGIYDADPAVVQGGFALAAGVRLPEEEL
jgi:CRISPR/Cas system CSM-associated protein Csm4 (group 5 of RAMP superfamily)